MNPSPQVGEQAPDFTLQDVYGKTVSLAHYRQRPVLLVFMRHLGCLFTRMHLARLRKEYGNIQHKNGEVIVVSFEGAEGLKKLIAGHKLPFVFLMDPTLEIYKEYNMIYRETGRIYSLKTIIGHLRLRLAGYPRQKQGSHPRQMGGDVIVDREGMVRYIHRSNSPEDRTGSEEIMAVFHQNT